MWSSEYFDEDFSVKDGVYGIITGGCKKGLFITLENGQEAFAEFGGYPYGTKVLCTVLKKATDKWRVFVSIDSVINEEAIAA